MLTIAYEKDSNQSHLTLYDCHKCLNECNKCNVMNLGNIDRFAMESFTRLRKTISPFLNLF